MRGLPFYKRAIRRGASARMAIQGLQRSLTFVEKATIKVPDPRGVEPATAPGHPVIRSRGADVAAGWALGMTGGLSFDKWVPIFERHGHSG